MSVLSALTRLPLMTNLHFHCLLHQEKEIAALEEKDTEKPGLKLPPIF